MKQQSQAIVVPGQDALTASMLAAALPQEQKQMLGERLFPLIQHMYPDLAGKITGMLLEIENSELLHMLESTESLKAKVEESVAVLMAHQAKEAAANQALTASFQSMPGGPVRPGPRTSASGNTGGGPGAQQQKRPSTMNARPITSQHTAQAQPGMSIPQSSMPGRPQQPKAPTMPQGARPGYSQFQNNRPQQSQAIVVPGQDFLTASMLAAAPPQEQKQMLGERLFPLIRRMYPDLAGKLTGMLLEIENSELLHMLESTVSLKAKVEEAVAVLQTNQAKEAAANQAASNALKKE